MMMAQHGISDNERPNRGLDNNILMGRRNDHRVEGGVVCRTRRVSFRLDHTSYFATPLKKGFNSFESPPSSPMIAPLLPEMDSLPPTLLPPCVPEHFSSFVAPPKPLPLPPVEPATKNCIEKESLPAPPPSAGHQKTPQEDKQFVVSNHASTSDDRGDDSNCCHTTTLISSKGRSIPVTTGRAVTQETSSAMATQSKKQEPTLQQQRTPPPPPSSKPDPEIKKTPPRIGVDKDNGRGDIIDESTGPRPFPRRRSVPPRIPTDASVFPPQFKRDSNLPERSSHQKTGCCSPPFHHRRRRRRRHSSPPGLSQQQQLVVVQTWNEDLADLRNQLHLRTEPKEKHQQSSTCTSVDDSSTTVSETASFADYDDNYNAGDEEEPAGRWLTENTEDQPLDRSVPLLLVPVTSVDRAPQVSAAAVRSTNSTTLLCLLEDGMLLEKADTVTNKSPASVLLQRKKSTATSVAMDDQSKVMMGSHDSEQRTTASNDEQSTMMMVLSKTHSTFVAQSGRVQSLLVVLMLTIGMVLRLLVF